MTTGQVAKIADVAPRTVSKWFDSEALKGYRIPMSQDRRVPVESLVSFLEEHNMPDIETLTDGEFTVVNGTLVARDPIESLG